MLDFSGPNVACVRTATADTFSVYICDSVWWHTKQTFEVFFLCCFSVFFLLLFFPLFTQHICRVSVCVVNYTNAHCNTHTKLTANLCGVYPVAARRCHRNSSSRYWYFQFKVVALLALYTSQWQNTNRTRMWTNGACMAGDDVCLYTCLYAFCAVKNRMMIRVSFFL